MFSADIGILLWVGNVVNICGRELPRSAVPLFVQCCQMLPPAPLFVVLFIRSLVLPNVLYALGQGQVILLLLIVLLPFGVRLAQCTMLGPIV